MIFGAFLGRPDRRAAPSRHILFDGVGVLSDVEACLSADSRCSILFPIVLDAEGMGVLRSVPRAWEPRKTA